MKADKDYVYKGDIYLKGAEMPEGWEPPTLRKAPTGVTMIGPEGVLKELPRLPLPPNVIPPEGTPERPEGAVEPPEGAPETATAPEAEPKLFDLSVEDLNKLAAERNLTVPRNARKAELIALLTPKE